MNLLDLFTGGTNSAIGQVGKAIGGTLDRFFPKKMTEKEKAEIFMDRIDKDIEREKVSLRDIADARKMFMVEMSHQPQPWLVRMMLGLFRPLAGFLSLWVAFYPYFRPLLNSWFNLDMPNVELSDTKFLAIMGVVTTIILFFFGSGHFGGLSSADRKPGE